MEIRVNGKQEIVTAQLSISGYLVQRQIPADHVVVEMNRNIINRDAWQSTMLTDGDCLEIVQFVGGG